MRYSCVPHRSFCVCLPNSHFLWLHLLILVAYSSDAVYLYSTMDDATETVDLGDREYPDENVPVDTFGEMQSRSFFDELLGNHTPAVANLGVDDDGETTQADNGADSAVLLSHHPETTSEPDNNDEDVQEYRLSNSSVPIVLPRRRYAGTCNIETVKDGKFLAYIHISSAILFP
jgi:hypothetical protein